VLARYATGLCWLKDAKKWGGDVDDGRREQWFVGWDVIICSKV
jgi:hypothetical protein